MSDKIEKTEEEWRRELTPEQYRVCREHGTERAFTGQYWDHHEAGLYRCAACGLELFVACRPDEGEFGIVEILRPVAPGSRYLVARAADHEVDASRNRRTQTIDRKARNPLQTGLPRGQPRPVVGHAPSQRCNEAKTCHGDKRPSLAVVSLSGHFNLRWLSAMPSLRPASVPSR